MKKITILFVALAMIFQSCSSEQKNTVLTVRLTDAPGDYEEVIIDISDIQISESSEDSEENWISLNGIKRGKYNLLDFTNGSDTILVSDIMPEGHISQIRLLLGENNFVKINGEYHDLKTPSAQQSGLKLKTDINLIEGVEYDLWIDFNAAKSVVANKNIYILKPVLRAFSEATSGSIKGAIDPSYAKCLITVISEDFKQTLSTYSDTANGFFMIKGVADGKYEVQIEELCTGKKFTVTNVIVEIGESTNLGTISLN